MSCLTGSGRHLAKLAGAAPSRRSDKQRKHHGPSGRVVAEAAPRAAAQDVVEVPEQARRAGNKIGRARVAGTENPQARLKSTSARTRKPLQGLALETFSEGGTMLGALELKGKALILRVNSKERAALVGQGQGSGRRHHVAVEDHGSVPFIGGGRRGPRVNGRTG
ncbi:hypothetical protein ACN9JG_17340 (plasmid) [Cereibacter azotoformans]|uniref:hypothetical protein n=1 Tax=Cereibacter azotoformans TaxID=43057 RepID=UPI003B2161D1